MLVAALAPAVSAAMAQGQQPSWIEVCSAAGSRWVAATTTATADADGGAQRQSLPASDASGMAHCAYCSLHSDTPALPPAPAIELPLLPADVLLPAAFLSAPRTGHAWVTASPRAPPTIA